jgi:hypothetical protein
MSDTVASTPQRRSYWQSLAGAGPSRRFWGRLVVAVLFILPLVAMYAGHLLYRVMGEIPALKAADPIAASSIIYELRSVGFLFLSVIILLCLIGIYFVFFLTVRVFGPQVALLRFIEQLRAGNYEPYRSLRRDDQLKEIWEALQGLAADLKRRGGK